MKDYQKAMEFLLTQGTAKALANKWAKLASTTQDEDLRSLAIELNRVYGMYIKPGWSRRAETAPVIRGIVVDCYSAYHQAHGQIRMQTKNYVEEKLAQGKPEWMVMAEKHGWRPPNH